jgi:hypothetical protein
MIAMASRNMSAISAWVCGYFWLFVAVARAAAGGATFSAGFAGLITIPLVRRALHVRGSPALAGDFALLLGIH